MDTGKYRFSSSTRQNTQNIRLGRSYTKPHYASSSPSSYDDGKKSVWKMLWRKLKVKRDKKRVFNSPPLEGIYDPETYSMNFDQGTGWMEPDNLPRSFSARYADPSRICHQDIYWLDDQQSM